MFWSWIFPDALDSCPRRQRKPQAQRASRRFEPHRREMGREISHLEIFLRQNALPRFRNPGAFAHNRHLTSTSCITPPGCPPRFNRGYRHYIIQRWASPWRGSQVAVIHYISLHGTRFGQHWVGGRFAMVDNLTHPETGAATFTGTMRSHGSYGNMYVSMRAWQQGQDQK